MAWTADPKDKAEGSHVVHLDLDDVTAVKEALDKFNARELDLDDVTRENFPLPTLQTRLEAAAREVHNRRGYSIVKGFDPSKYTDEENVAIFLAISNYIGEQRGFQDKKGSMLTHVTSAKVWTVPPKKRHGIHTTTGLPWHCDLGTEVLALHVRGLPKSGGDTFISSSWAIYEELKASNPETLKALQARDWPIQVSGDPVDYISSPLLHVLDDKVLISVDPGRLGLHPATAKTDPDSSTAHELNSAQQEALKVLSTLATKHRRRLDLEKGDMVFINNLSLLHARESYKDHETGPGRHLVRLWLRNKELAWEVPKEIWAPWEAAFGPDGEGFSESRERLYPVTPPMEYEEPKYTAGSAAFMLEDGKDVNGGGNKKG
ncbi:hypothetical protein C8A05DRAFT_40786 [Staphylotrichum tortipilum]|uniref:TauD/TfdA-like domain-containing protein n=1 Tax=Staphylotrichum tortipilum TaxID=2831512 RepID=A0AAN6RWS3_9PEZI|nr:hypothetical protein C8A05DRAFT_40786 [Staphylotrichum longicolle]